MSEEEKVSTNSLQRELMNVIKAHEKVSSFEDSISEKYQRIVDSVSTNDSIKDSYGNSLLDIGNQNHTEHFSNYTFTNDTLNWPLWLALYNESWVFKRAIDKPAQDCIRCGITIEGEFEGKKSVERKLKTYKDDMVELLTWGGLFGGSLAIAMFDNFSDKDYEYPLNKVKLRQTKSMKFYVVDRWYGVSPSYDEVVTDMNDIDYGKPKYYEITMPDGKTYKYHHDYVIRFEGRIAPKIVKNGMLQGWGYSEGSHILNCLAEDEKLKASIQSLVDKSLIEVIKMSGMRGVFMGSLDQKNEQQLRARLEMVNWGRNFNSLTFLDKEDDYQQNTFNGLSGLSDLLQQNMWQIAAALEMQGVLFGDMKQGFSTDSDALERYDEVINGRCETYVRKPYEKLLTFIYTMLGIEEKVEFSFNSLLVKRHDKEKMESINTFVDLCSKLLADGVLSTKLYAKALNNYTLHDSIDFGLTQEEIDKMDDEMHNELEGADVSMEEFV